MANIQAAMIGRDAALLESSAHRLKGAASTMSAQPVAEAAAKLEQVARRGELDGIDETFRALETHAAELASELEAFINSETK